VRRKVVAFAALVTALAVPGVADAATYRVAAGGGGCGGSDTTCGTIAAAAGAAASGDAVDVAPGTYTESATFGAAVTVTGSSEGGGVIVNGTLTFSAGGAVPSVLQKLIVASQAGGGPAVVASGGAGTVVRDAVLLSADGPGLSITNGSLNKLTRSSVLVAGANATAVSLALGAESATLKIDSSVISGGASGVGLAVKTGIGTLVSAGTATVSARHVTIAGAATGISLDSSSATGLLSAQGSIAVTASDSIVQGATPTKSNAGLLGPLLPPNTATLTLARTDQTTAADALFVSTARRNYHLRADASVIDKGGPVESGDSETDLDGQPRVAGAASDLGADEFGNTPPTAIIELKTAVPRTGQPVAFDGSGSTDRETAIGGPIAEYRWTFGDGVSVTTTTPTVEHTYSREGALVAQLVVVDRQGAASTPAAVPVRLSPGTVPTVVITKPEKNAKLALLAKKRKGAKRRARTKIAFAGTAKAADGVKSVVLTIEKLGTSKKTCTWVDKRKGLVKTPCAKPVLINAKLTAGKWSYTVASTIKLTKGAYRVSAYGTDAGGGFGNAAATSKRIVRFSLK
jgi:hypothetical protein